MSISRWNNICMHWRINVRCTTHQISKLLEQCSCIFGRHHSPSLQSVHLSAAITFNSIYLLYRCKAMSASLTKTTISRESIDANCNAIDMMSVSAPTVSGNESDASSLTKSQKTIFIKCHRCVPIEHYIWKRFRNLASIMGMLMILDWWIVITIKNNNWLFTQAWHDTADTHTHDRVKRWPSWPTNLMQWASTINNISHSTW